MNQYLFWLNKILLEGERREDRTGVGTLSIFGEAQLTFDLQNGFPLVTTRRIKFENVVDELLWFISGSTNVNDLPRNTQPWWRPWAAPNGDLGPIYGSQLRNFDGIDQLQETIDNLKVNPQSRRHIITLWNPVEIDLMALPPCHGLVIQFNVREDLYLDCKMYIRSNDWFLGAPANIASYSLLTHMIAQITDLIAGRLYYTVGDAHVYLNHIQPAHTQLARIPRPLPSLYLNYAIKDIEDFTPRDIHLHDYNSYPHIPAKIAV